MAPISMKTSSFLNGMIKRARHRPLTRKQFRSRSLRRRVNPFGNRSLANRRKPRQRMRIWNSNGLPWTKIKLRTTIDFNRHLPLANARVRSTRKSQVKTADRSHLTILDSFDRYHLLCGRIQLRCHRRHASLFSIAFSFWSLRRFK